MGVVSCYPRGAAGGTSRHACAILFFSLCGMGVVSCYPRGAAGGTSRP